MIIIFDFFHDYIDISELQSLIEMSKSPFLVYVLPIILSVGLGTLVMAEALNDSERELDMWQIGVANNISTQTIQLIGLEAKYSVSDPIEFEIRVMDSTFNCGDLYITVYKITNSTKQVVTQSGFLNQCYITENSNLPIDNNYSEILGETGEYEILIELYDKTYKQTYSHSENLRVN